MGMRGPSTHFRPPAAWVSPPLSDQFYLLLSSINRANAAGLEMADIFLNFLRTQWAALSPYFAKASYGLIGNAQTGNVPRNSASPTLVQRDEEDCTTPSEEYICSGQIDQSESNTYPLTSQQVEASIKEFINSINKAAVCDVASRFNGGKLCKVVDQRNGSFNICFFVHFDAENITWVLRIPIEPVVSNAWAKVVSEVTTIK